MTVAMVLVGGAIGAPLRYLADSWLSRLVGGLFPWGTFAVNMLGSFAIGFLAVWLEGRGPSALFWRAFLIVGVLGAFTTWSSLMLECLLMARTERTTMMMAYLGISLVTGLVLVWLGTKAAGLIRIPVW